VAIGGSSEVGERKTIAARLADSKTSAGVELPMTVLCLEI
jgi:hypothetical protein